MKKASALLMALWEKVFISAYGRRTGVTDGKRTALWRAADRVVADGRRMSFEG